MRKLLFLSVTLALVSSSCTKNNNLNGNNNYSITTPSPSSYWTVNGNTYHATSDAFFDGNSNIKASDTAGNSINIYLLRSTSATSDSLVTGTFYLLGSNVLVDSNFYYVEAIFPSPEVFGPGYSIGYGSFYSSNVSVNTQPTDTMTVGFNGTTAIINIKSTVFYGKYYSNDTAYNPIPPHVPNINDSLSGVYDTTTISGTIILPAASITQP